MQREPAGKTAEVKRSRENARSVGVDRGAAPLLPRLHKTAGNRSVARFVQAKLRVSQPGDAAEREADRIADEITRSPAAAVRPEQSLRGQTPLILPKPGVGIAAPAANVSAAVAGGGQPLADPQRTRFESLLGHDFGDVRIHTGDQAATSAEALGALAYTVGSDVVFSRGQYSPSTAAGQHLLAHELVHVVQQRQDTPRIQRKEDPGKKIPFLEVAAQDFDEAARNFALMLASKTHFKKPPRIVVVNGPNVRIYDESGNPVEKKFFHLNAPVFLPIGVFGAVNGPVLHAIQIKPSGDWEIGAEVAVQQRLDFGKDIDDQEGFNKAVEGHPIFYVSPKSTAVAEGADAPAPVPIENLPEFMKFEAKNKANLPAWPSITLPLTPQLATVNSTGTFKCMVDKNQGSSTIDRVTNLMQPTAFRWEVLKVDEKLRVTSKKGTSAWDAAVEGYSRRFRNLEDDRRAMIGDPKKQGIAKTALKSAIAEPITDARAALAIVGQTVMTVVNAITGGPNQLTTEDIMDVPFKEQGDFFVRCLATQIVPEDAKFRRATSVSGCMISVYNIQEVASSSLLSAEDYAKQAESSLGDLNSQIANLDEAIAAGTGDAVVNKVHREYLALSADYQKNLVQAGSNPLERKLAELTYVKSVLNYFADEGYPRGGQFDAFREGQVPKFKKRQAELEEELKAMRNRLTDRDSAIVPIGYMNAVLVDEMTGGRMPLTFAVGERQYVAADDLEVVIADVSSAKEGRIFDGRGSGFQGAGRHDAWLDAMDDLRKNLNRGRGYLSYEVPKQYEAWKSELPNPMQLQMSASAQFKEMVDDAAHALTVAAILAAPFTGGASLGILAVLAPIQAASSLYNIVNRAMYNDLQMDSEAVFDFINIATLGLGKISTAGKFATKSVEIVASSSRLAIRLLNAGQMIMITYETFHVLMEEGSNDPNVDPRELRRKKLLKLLSFFEAASIPIAEKVFAAAHAPGSKEAGDRAQKQKELSFDEPTQIIGKKKPAIHEGEFQTRPKRPTEAPGHEEAGGPGEKAAPKGTTEGAPGEAATYKPTKEQLKGVPARLRGKVAVVEGMGRDARVVYKRGDNGLITDVQIQIGEHASAADVNTHVAVADMIMKYAGLGGRMRRLLENFKSLFSGETPPEIGSRAWEANLEMIKLDRMMRERHAELAELADQPADLRDTSRMAELQADIDILESQFIEHAEVFNSIEMGTEKGRGYVAAEGLAEGERVRKERKFPEAPKGYRWRYRKGQLEVVVIEKGKPKRVYDEATGKFVKDTGEHVSESFDANTDRREAFRELGGYDKKTPFGQFVEVLLELGVIESRQDVIKKMTDPANRTHDTVRGNVKDIFKERLVDRLTDTKQLKKTARYKEVLAATGNAEQARRAAGMEEMLRITERLGPEDRGSIGERVYGELFGTKKAALHVDISPAELAAAKGVAESEIEQGRSIDRLDGNTAREVKTVSTRLGPRERGQINDMLDMVGEEVYPTGAKPRTIEQVAVAFTDPKGGAANATLAYELLSSDPKAPLTFEFHTADGKVLKVTAKNMDILLKDDFRTKLGLPAKTPGSG